MQKVLENRSFLSLLLLVSLLFAALLAPFFHPIFWACVIAILFAPLQKFFVCRWQHPNISALITLTLCCVLVIAPCIIIISSFFKEALNLYQQVQNGSIDPGAYFDRIKLAFPVIQDFLDNIGIDPVEIRAKLGAFAGSLGKTVASKAVRFGQGTVHILLQLGILLYISFFLLRDGEKLVRIVRRALPLGDEREELLFSKFSEVTRATVKGSLIVAIVQGTLGGLIFWALNIHAALLWGVVMVILSLIPVVGAGLVWVPVAVYLFATGDMISGGVLVLFGTCVIGLADNILRPLLVGRDTKLPDYLVLLSTLGGFSVFGMNGFVMGPLIAVLFVTFWGIFSREFNPQAEEFDCKL